MSTQKDHIAKLIINHTRRQQKLKEQKALYGHSADPQILLEIEDIEKELEILKDELDKTDKQSQVISPAPVAQTPAVEPILLNTLRKLIKQKQESIYYPFQLSESRPDGNFFDSFIHLKLKRDAILSLIDLELLKKTNARSYRFTSKAYDVMGITLSESEKNTLRRLMDYKQKEALYPFYFVVNNEWNFVEPNSNEPEFTGCDIETLIDFKLLERDKGNNYRITAKGYSALSGNFIRYGIR